MSSQEEYLDQLLNNIMNGGKEQPQEDDEGAAEVRSAAQTSGRAPEMFGDGQVMPGMFGMPDTMSGMPDLTGMPGMSGAESGVSDLSGMSGFMGEMPEMSGMPDLTGMPGMSGAESGVSDLSGMPGFMGEMTEMSGMPELTGMSGMPGAESELSDLLGMSDFMGEMPGMSGGMPGMPDLTGMPEIAETPESSSDILGRDAEDPDITELLKSFEDAGSIPDENTEESEMDVSSMSEDDIERLLAANRKISGSSGDSPKEAFQGDVVDLLEGTKDSELQEIQKLLEKSDNNEAVGDEIEEILRGAVQDNFQNSSGGSHPEMDADNIDGAEEQLSPKQQRAMEKKRIKEEKAAARKAEKEAKKAEKEARKAAKKAGKSNNSGQDDGRTLSTETSGGTAAETGEPVDTAFLDSILSEAGKINGAETISSATGNYDAKVDNIIPDDSEEAAASQNTAAGTLSSANDGLGIDLNNLFGDSSEAESAMMAGNGTSELPDFMVLDGDDVTGITELAGEGEEESKPRKKGFFSRFLEFLTEEDEEEEENEDIKLSDENKEIIEDLDKEKNQKDKKGKKGKKKAKKADASAEGEEEGDEEGGENKKSKKKKAKKPKKEKLPKEEEPVEPGKRLSLKKVLPIVLICLSLGAAIIILTFASVNFTDKNAARDAYYNEDYMTCYQNLYGKDLSESEQVMFAKSECILTIRLWIREYEMLTAEGAGLEALDSLIQSVNDYPTLYDYATKWNAGGEVAQEYATILNLLYENYGLTEDQARAIAAESDDIEYTRQVNIILQGGTFGSWNEPEPEVEVPLRDELPEETELPEGNFIDTNTSVQ